MDRFGNPFAIASDVEELERPAPLINMATGVVAPDQVTKELLTGKELSRTAWIMPSIAFKIKIFR